MFKSLNIRNSGEKYKECELPEKFPDPSVDDEFLPNWETTMEPSGKNGDLREQYSLLKFCLKRLSKRV